MNDFNGYSPPMERTVYGIVHPTWSDDSSADQDRMTHPQRLGGGGGGERPDYRPVVKSESEEDLEAPAYDLTIMPLPEKDGAYRSSLFASHLGSTECRADLSVVLTAMAAAPDCGLDMRMDGHGLPREPSWNFTPDLDLHQFSTFSAALSPYSTISPYVPAVRRPPRWLSHRAVLTFFSL